ncbi:MAG TPA: LysM peptidoglycan-binding domain-containing protein [Bryobacteraceae bacterium]|jgi:nucleoid-associated protein YgaU|nr:LysM peptidoglycan-binding domain-containing protein [Bryobacteraceae bacterium]
MDRLEELKNKYQPVLDAIKQRGVVLSHLHVQDNKLFMQGAAPSQDIKNEIWNQIKAVDPQYSDLTADINVDTSLPQPTQPRSAPSEQTYTVQPGDSLWKISEHFYGKGHLFKSIISANPDKLKDEHSVIHPGDTLKIPAAAEAAGRS